MSSTKHLTLKLGETSETLRQSHSFKRFNGFLRHKSKIHGRVLLYEGKTQWGKNEITDYNKSMEKANILIPLTKKKANQKLLEFFLRLTDRAEEKSWESITLLLLRDSL